MKKLRFLFFNIFFLLLFLVTCHLSPATIFASDFLVNYNVAYRINEEGKTVVTQNVSLNNKKTNLYAKEYSISIDSTKIKNVSAADSKGTIEPEIKTRDGKTEIRLTFNDQVVGLGSTLKFTLSYEDENIAKKNGAIWEVNIPGIAQDADLGEYNVKLSVPSSFGQPAYLVPQPKSELLWTKEQLINGGVSAAFGDRQLFELNLSYFIDNPKQQTVMTEIALPPSTSYQDVTIESIDPEPESIIPDEDGNWLARYKLAKGESKTIRASVIVQLFLKPRRYAYPMKEELRSEYISPTEYWTSNDPTIQELAQKLKTPREIYDYVVKTLSYDYSRVNENSSRKGASIALKTPKNAVCMEYTDLFIAIARAAGIPARQAVGYAFTTNTKLRPLSLVSDVLHAWPEYYDSEKKRWIPVDPTWGSTTGGIDYYEKLDFNHIVFAYNGIRDAYPYPAGFYRQMGKTGKDIEVRFRDGIVPQKSAELKTTIEVNKQILAGFNTEGAIQIRNTSKVASEDTTVDISSDTFPITKHYDSLVIPPYGMTSLPISVHPSQYLSFGQAAITATVNGTTQTQYVTIRPAYHILGPILIIGVWVLVTIAILINRTLHWKKIRK